MQATALFADRAWQRLLTRDADLTVASVFSSTLNLVSQQTGEWYTVFTKDGYNAPRALTVSAPVHVQVGETVRTNGEMMRFANATILLERCDFVDNRMAVLPLPKDRQVRHLEQWLAARATKGSFYGSISEDVVNKSIVTKLIAARTNLTKAIRHGVDIETAVSRCIGLGVGLTPSGDDYLVGWLAVMWQTDAFNEEKERVSKTIRKYMEKTTQISQLYLQEATTGNFAEPIRTLSEAVSGGSAESTEAAAEILLRHGATSGQDIMTGMIDAWDTYKHKEKNNEI